MNTVLSRSTPSIPRACGPRFDDDGFLVDTDQWTPGLARQLAADAGIDELTAPHWRVIEHVRSRFFALGSLPVMRLVCRAAGIEPGTAHRLFDGCAAVWRIAGLPNPGEEARTYMH